MKNVLILIVLGFSFNLFSCEKILKREVEIDCRSDKFKRITASCDDVRFFDNYIACFDWKKNGADKYYFYNDWDCAVAVKDRMVEMRRIESGK